MYDVLGKRKSAASLTAVFTIIDPVDVAGMTDLLLYRFCFETPLSAIYNHMLAFRDRVNVFDRRCRRKATEIVRLTFIPIIAAASLSCATARIALPCLVFRMKYERPISSGTVTAMMKRFFQR